MFPRVLDLEEAVDNGAMSRDFYHRVGGLTLTVPPLRDRVEDLPDLVDMILERCGRGEVEIEDGVVA